MARSAKDEDAERAADLIAAGSEMASAAAGGALGLIGGPPGIAAGAVGGVVVSRVVKRLGAELQERVLGSRQRIRAGAAFAVAADRIREYLEQGQHPRDDGFFDAHDTGRAPADELLEGVLLQAADSYEERKVPYVGALFASLAFRDDVSPAHAHVLIRLAGELTYRQFQAVAYFAENAESNDLVFLDGRRQESGRHPFPNGFGREFTELSDLGLIGFVRRGHPITRSDETWRGVGPEEQRLASLAPTSTGDLLYELMELARIPLSEKRAIFELMDTTAPRR